MPTETRTPALDALSAQGQYTFAITGFDVVVTLREDESQPITKTGFLLKVVPNRGSPDIFSTKLTFRISGPVTAYDRTEAGQAIFGAIGVKEEGCEIFVAGTETFISHSLATLNLLTSEAPRFRCTMTLTTAYSVDSTKPGFVPILGVQLSAREL